jgi:hypothetical protein
MSENKALWKRAFTTDPKAVKAITGKQYSGNSPKPYWIVERLTDEFGPCGIGWGFSVADERFERFGEGSKAEALHIARVRFWFMLGDKRGEFEQIGQTRASYTTNAGKFLVDEDAPKKSVTDALVKCASYLGFAGDIFSGRWDDSKYVRAAGQEWEERKAAEATPPARAEVKEPPTAPLTESQVLDWISSIYGASADELPAIETGAYAAATAAKDRAAYKQFRAALEKRKEGAAT